MDRMADVLKNRFAGYTEQRTKEVKKLNPVHEVVNNYYKMIGMESAPKSSFKGRYGYPKLAGEAKRLLESCGGNLDDALWCLDRMNYKAQRFGYDWSISTCLKHDLNWGTR